MILIKIGGGENINISGIISDLAGIQEKAIIIHGANAARDSLASALGKTKITIESVSGYSSVYSDETAIDLILMAYAGLKNKRIVEQCQQNGINAIGLSGIDGGLIRARRNRGIKTIKNGKRMILRDFSGKPVDINSELLLDLLDKGYTPVVSIPLLDEKGFAVNSENDDILALLQSVLRAEKIISFIEAPGFLDDKEDENSLVKMMTGKELQKREEQVEGRMKRKMLALRKLFEAGPTTVILCDGRTEHPLRDALAGSGTIIR